MKFILIFLLHPTPTPLNKTTRWYVEDTKYISASNIVEFKDREFLTCSTDKKATIIEHENLKNCKKRDYCELTLKQDYNWNVYFGTCIDLKTELNQ